MWKYLIALLFFFMCIQLCCGPKPFLWQGQYVKINTVEQPKEDFTVGDYVVVSYAPYEYKKNVTRLYKFVLIQNGKQVGLITLDKHEFIKTVYYLEENNVHRERNFFCISSSGNHVTYNQYKNPPDYSKMRSDIEMLLLGGELVPESIGE